MVYDVVFKKRVDEAAVHIGVNRFGNIIKVPGIHGNLIKKAKVGVKNSTYGK
jgi:hypothetical protein